MLPPGLLLQPAEISGRFRSFDIDAEDGPIGHNGSDSEFSSGLSLGLLDGGVSGRGRLNVNGKGESIWDRFSHTQGRVKGDWTGDVACDEYHRYAADIAIMKRMNLSSYRYSISWPRIQPTGWGAPDAKGLDYYKRLTDAVHAAGMRPLVTIYHWDLPQALEEKGGWPNRDTAARFADERRIHFYREHLREMSRAMKDGADVRGYHAWSILDNFEWAEGYTQRFGMVYVDFRNQRRYVKDSAKWYSQVAKTNICE